MPRELIPRDDVARETEGERLRRVIERLLEPRAQVAAGQVHSLALLLPGGLLPRGGKVRAWGENIFGQLGDGTTTDSSTPVKVQARGMVIAIAGGGNHSLALDSLWGILPYGTVWAWGDNTFGQLGDGTTATSAVPVPVRDQSGQPVVGWVAVAGGWAHSLALFQDRTLWAWGLNNRGQLGDGTITNRLLAVAVRDLSGKPLMWVVAAAAGGAHSLALLQDETVWAWGDNSFGQLGDGRSGGNSTRPGQVQGLSGVVAIAAGYLHSLAVLKDGTVWAWGLNNLGQLGDGSTLDRPTPVPVLDLNGQPLGDVIAIAGGGWHSLALRRDGTVWAWGYNANGQLGDGSTVNRPTAVVVRDLNGQPLKGWVAIAAGYSHSLAALENGTVWAWGYNQLGQLGNGTTMDSATPVKVQGLP